MTTCRAPGTPDALFWSHHTPPLLLLPSERRGRGPVPALGACVSVCEVPHQRSLRTVGLWMGAGGFSIGLDRVVLQDGHVSVCFRRQGGGTSRRPKKGGGGSTREWRVRYRGQQRAWIVWYRVRCAGYGIRDVARGPRTVLEVPAPRHARALRVMKERRPVRDPHRTCPVLRR